MKIATNAEQAVSLIKSGDRVFVHSVAAAPQQLLKAMVAMAPRLRDVEVVHIHTEGMSDYSKPEYSASFKPNVFFVGGNLRAAVQAHRADYVPVFLSEVPALFRRGVLPVDVAMLHLSP